MLLGGTPRSIGPVVHSRTPTPCGVGACGGLGVLLGLAVEQNLVGLGVLGVNRGVPLAID